MLMAFAITGFSKRIYVSAKGDDKMDGTKQNPFRTLQKAELVTKAGDTCFVSSGIYAECITFKNSGVQDNPIVFMAASEKDKVIITGADPIPHENWKRVEKNIFKCKITMMLKEENQIFLNEKTMVVARWPNVGNDLLKPVLATMDKGTTPELIIDNELPDYDFTGGQVWIHAKYWWSNWTSAIKNSGMKSLQIENLAPYPGPSRHVAAVNAGFFVFGIKDALDADNEWYYDEKEQELYVFRPNDILPEQEYLVKRRMNVFNLEGSKHIQFHGLNIVGAAIATNSETESILFNRMKVIYPYFSSADNGLKTKGFVLNGKNCTVQNSEIAYSSGSCITLSGENNKLLNSYIYDGNLFGAFLGCVVLQGKGNIISHCTITRSGRTLINYSGMYQALIQNCDLSHSGMLTSDLGLTYGTNIEGGNSEVRYNLMHHNHGQDKEKNMGLYYDHGTKNVISHHNIIWGVEKGLLINHYAANHLVYNNTFIAEDEGFRSSWGNMYAPDLLKCRFANNLFSSPCETTAENYYWNNNKVGYKEFDENDPMKAPKNEVGKGLFIEGITAAPKRTNPGLGAIEYEGMTFKAGHDFENPPKMDFKRSKPLYRNMIQNAAFEHEDYFSPWLRRDESVKPIEHTRQSHSNEDVNIGRMGEHSVELTKSGSELFQIVTGLLAGQEYEFIAHLRVDKNEQVILGVRFSNGTEQYSPLNDKGSAPHWKLSRLSFTMPTNGTEVEVFVRRLSGEKGKKVYIDDLSLNLL